LCFPNLAFVGNITPVGVFYLFSNNWEKDNLCIKKLKYYAEKN